MKAVITKDKFKVYATFPYKKEAIEEIKQIPMRRFDNFHKFWSVPLDHESDLVQILMKHGYQIEYQDVQPIPENVFHAVLSVFQNATPEEIINWQAQQVTRLEKREGFDVSNIIKSWRVILQAKNSGIL